MSTTPLDVIKSLGGEYLGTTTLPSGAELVQLRYERTRFSVKGRTADEILETAVRRICALKAEQMGASRDVGELVAEGLLNSMRTAAKAKIKERSDDARE